MNEDERIDAGMDLLWRKVEEHDSMSQLDRTKLWAGLALGSASNVHRFLHGKKHGASVAECDLDICRIFTALGAKNPEGSR